MHRLNVLRKRALSDGIRAGRERKGAVELIVKAADRRKDWLAGELGRVGEVTHVYRSIPYISFRCDSEDAYRLSKTFHKLADNRALKSVTSAISLMDISSIVSLPDVKSGAGGGLWNLDDIGAYAAKAVAEGSGVKVAVVDTGVDYTHPEVSGSFGSVKGYDFVRKSPDPMDFNGHGTHVAGIAVGRDYGIAGKASCYSVRVLDEEGFGSEAVSIAGLDWVAQHGVDVVNMSFGSRYASSALEDMCYYLADRGVLLVAAAGNSGFGANYPAAFGEPVVAVAAVDERNSHADFSNIYETNDISAPGVNITSSWIGGYATVSGTSMASPHVAGSLALALSALKKGSDLEEIMGDTAQPLDSGSFPERDVYGAGLLRVDRMVQGAMQGKLVVNSYAREVFSVLREVLWE